MSRLPEELIEQIKRLVLIMALLTERGITLTRKGAQYAAYCPLPGHEDDKPSFFVSPSKNRFRCFGCGVQGSVIDLLMALDSLDFRQAVEALRPRLLIATSSSEASESAAPAPALDEARRVELLELVTDEYHRVLLENVTGRAYLEQRGILSGELIREFRLGFCDRTLGTKLADRHSPKGMEDRRDLRELGILRMTGHESLAAGYIFVPLLNENGQPMHGYARKVSEGEPRHLYLRGPIRGLLNPKAFKASSALVLTEAPIDALTWWTHGFRAVSTAFGADGVTSELFDALLGMEHVILSFDNDERGEKGAHELAQRLLRERVGVWTVKLPGGIKDISEFAQKVTPASKSLGLLLHQMRWLGKLPVPARPLLAPATEIVPEIAPPELEIEVTPTRKTEAKVIGPEVSEAAVDVEDTEPGPRLSALPGPTPSRWVELPAQRFHPQPEPISETQDLDDIVIKPKTRLASAMDGEDLWLKVGSVRFRVRGLLDNKSPGHLKVGLMAVREERFHSTKLDLCDARDRGTFAKLAAVELAVEEDELKRSVGLVYLHTEQKQEEIVRSALSVKTPKHVMSAKEAEEAQALYKDPNVIDRIVADMGLCGYVGEENNKLLTYLVAVSRMLDKPLGLLIMSSSSAGKTSLLEIGLLFCPDEDKKIASAVTGQSLYYFGETELSHKALGVVEEEGAERASYPLKIMQSEQKLTIVSTVKDPKTGLHKATVHEVLGPVAILCTTTSVTVDDELANRCFTVSVSESRELTRMIHGEQRKAETLEGMLALRKRQKVVTVHQNFQRLLRRVAVANPFAEQLTFPDHRTEARRANARYLALIRVIAFVRQGSRPLRTKETDDGELFEYIEVEPSDIEIANRIMNDLVGHTLGELLPHTRQFLMRLDELVKAECEKDHVDRRAYRFTRRQIWESTGYGPTQVQEHLRRLEELEYVVSRGVDGRRLEYSLLYDGEGQDGGPFAMGLADPAKLATIRRTDLSETSRQLSDSESVLSASHRAEIGANSPGYRTSDFDDQANDPDELCEDEVDSSKTSNSGLPDELVAGNGRSDDE